MLYHLLHGAIKPNYIDLAKSLVQIYLSFGIVEILFKNANISYIFIMIAWRSFK